MEGTTVDLAMLGLVLALAAATWLLYRLAVALQATP
jgi:hypothetical protein